MSILLLLFRIPVGGIEESEVDKEVADALVASNIGEAEEASEANDWKMEKEETDRSLLKGAKGKASISPPSVRCFFRARQR